MKKPTSKSNVTRRWPQAYCATEGLLFAINGEGVPLYIYKASRNSITKIAAWKAAEKAWLIRPIERAIGAEGAR